MATLEQVTDGYVSAEDEDFVPDATVMAAAAAQAAKQASHQRRMSTAQLVAQRKAKSAASAMFAAMKAGPADAPAAAAVDGPKDEGAGQGTKANKTTTKKKAGTNKKKKKTKTKKRAAGKRRRAEDVLAALNRPNKAKRAQARRVVANILGGKVVRQAKRRRVSSVKMPVGGKLGSDKVVVKQVVKFAGKEMTVESAVASRGVKSGLDAAVSGLMDVHKVNTVDKSSMDWEVYKVEKGIGDDVEQAAKNGYVGKQEFLDRVDQRQYSLELQERKRQRAAAEAAAAAAAPR